MLPLIGSARPSPVAVVFVRSVMLEDVAQARCWPSIVRIAAIAVLVASVAACASGSDTPSTATRPVGTWTRAQAGKWNNVSWELFTVPATKGGLCYSLERTPGLWDADAVDSLRYQGHVPSCRGGNVIPSLTGGIDQSRNFPYNTVAGLARSDVKAVTALFDDGGAEPVSLAAETFVVFYASHRALVSLDVELAGGRARCAGVPIDLGKSTDPEWVPLRLDCDR